MDIVRGNRGWIEVIVGPMFSGKSEELIRRLRRCFEPHLTHDKKNENPPAQFRARSAGGGGR